MDEQHRTGGGMIGYVEGLYKKIYSGQINKLRYDPRQPVQVLGSHSMQAF